MTKKKRSNLLKPLGAVAERIKAVLTPGDDALKATDLLKFQHKEVDGLFMSIEAMRDRRDKIALFDELATNLVAHDAIEREIFYPACERALGEKELLTEALVEHGLVEFALYQADRARGANDFAAKVKALKEVVKHHVKEEENNLFPKVERALSKEQLIALGAKLESAFEEATAKSFREPLYDNLQQVLEGAVKTKPKKKAKVIKKSKKKTKAPRKRTTKAQRQRKIQRKRTRAA